MKLTRANLLVFVLLVGAARLLAQDSGESKVTADFGYASRYVFRGVERAGSSAQASVEYAAHGFRGSVWTNQPLRSEQDGEIDLTTAYAHQVSEKLNIELALTAYYPTSAGAGATERSIEAGITATWTPISGFTPSVSLQHDFQLESNSAQAALACSVALTKLGAFLELSAFAGWSDARNARPDEGGPRVGDGYGYFGGEAHIPYRMGAHTTVIAGIHATTTVGQGRTLAVPGRFARSNLWLTLGVSVDF